MNKWQAYKLAAGIGGVVGFVTAIALQKRWLLWTIGFAIGGGYIGYSLVESAEPPKTNFTNVDAEMEKAQSEFKS